MAASRRLVRRLHPDDRAAPQGGRHGARRSGSTTPATSTRASTKAGTASAARPSSRRRISSTASVRCIRRRRRSGFGKRTSSSACRSTSSRCSITSPRIPSSSSPRMRRNEILRLLEGGLDDISVSRAGQSWGIPLPFDPVERRLRLVRRADQLRVGGRPGQRRRRSSTKWWPADLHVIGKDITRFHTVIWPAMLMSARLPLPRQVFGHGFMTFERPADEQVARARSSIPIEAADRFGADPLRLFLTKEIAFGGDGDFSWERYDERYNTDLANNLGNLVSRVTTMAHRYRQGRLAPTGAAVGSAGAARRAGRDRLPARDGRASPFTRARRRRTA